MASTLCARGRGARPADRRPLRGLARPAQRAQAQPPRGDSASARSATPRSSHDMRATSPLHSDALRDVAAPVLAIYGEKSDLRERGQAFLRSLPCCQLDVLPGLHALRPLGGDRRGAPPRRRLPAQDEPMKVLFVVPPLTGHVNPTVSIAARARRARPRGRLGRPRRARRVAASAGRRGLESLGELPGDVVAAIAERSRRVRGLESVQFLWQDFLVPLARQMRPAVEQVIRALPPRRHRRRSAGDRRRARRAAPRRPVGDALHDHRRARRAARRLPQGEGLDRRPARRAAGAGRAARRRERRSLAVAGHRALDARARRERAGAVAGRLGRARVQRSARRHAVPLGRAAAGAARARLARHGERRPRSALLRRRRRRRGAPA